MKSEMNEMNDVAVNTHVNTHCSHTIIAIRGTNTFTVRYSFYNVILVLSTLPFNTHMKI